MTLLTGIRVILLAIATAIVSILFCLAMQATSNAFKKYFKNQYIRIFVGGILLVLLTLAVGCHDYNGAGMNIIEQAIHGEAKPEAFLLKLIFTCITISCGFRGGEIVPSFFIGATFGCTLGGILGLDPGFGAAMGLVCLFCGVVNCPLASLVLSIELFGPDGILLFAIGTSVSYMLSGYYSLYSEQKIIYSKLRPHYVNLYTNQEVKTNEHDEKKKADGIFHQLSFFVLLLFLFCFSTLRKTTQKSFRTFSCHSYRIFQMYRTCQSYQICRPYRIYHLCPICHPYPTYHLCPIYHPCRTYHPYRLFLLPSYPLFLFFFVPLRITLFRLS